MNKVSIELRKLDGSNVFIIIHNILYFFTIISNLIFVSLLYIKRIYWQLDNYKLHKINNLFQIVVKQLINIFFVLFTINLLDFIFLLQNLSINKPNIKKFIVN